VSPLAFERQVGAIALRAGALDAWKTCDPAED
jgi:hypothetical protein